MRAQSHFFRASAAAALGLIAARMVGLVMYGIIVSSIISPPAKAQIPLLLSCRRQSQRQVLSRKSLRLVGNMFPTKKFDSRIPMRHI